MKLTRFGFNILVFFWLLPLVLIDIIGNTINTGTTSEFYYYKAMFDGLLIAYALYELFTDSGTANVQTAKARQDKQEDTVVSFGQIAAFEYVYCLFLAAYAVVNWWSLHMINKEATGVASMASLVWSFVSLAVALLAALQFWRLKSGQLVELTHKVVQ